MADSNTEIRASRSIFLQRHVVGVDRGFLDVTEFADRRHCGLQGAKGDADFQVGAGGAVIYRGII